jgi:hypothetical protein
MGVFVSVMALPNEAPTASPMMTLNAVDAVPMIDSLLELVYQAGALVLLMGWLMIPIGVAAIVFGLVILCLPVTSGVPTGRQATPDTPPSGSGGLTSLYYRERKIRERLNQQATKVPH